jgi:hypothetical protein
MRAFGGFIGGVLLALAGVFLFVSKGGALLSARETPAVSDKSPAAGTGNTAEGDTAPPSSATASSDAAAPSSSSASPWHRFTTGGGAETLKIGNVIILMPARKTPDQEGGGQRP